MEEDIKILEQEINDIYVGCGATITNAIENLIKGYRELEEENKRLDRQRIIGNIYGIKVEDLKDVLSPYYIPKSKVKEKIGELTKIKNEFKDTLYEVELCYKINILQELIEEE